MSCAAGLLAAIFHATPTAPADFARALFAYTDAAKEGIKVACLGCLLHNFSFSFPIPSDVLGYPIPHLEFQAFISKRQSWPSAALSASPS